MKIKVSKVKELIENKINQGEKIKFPMSEQFKLGLECALSMITKEVEKPQ